MYIYTGSPVPNIPSKSRGLAGQMKIKIFDGMEMIRNNCIVFFFLHQLLFQLYFILKKNTFCHCSLKLMFDYLTRSSFDISINVNCKFNFEENS